MGIRIELFLCIEETMATPVACRRVSALAASIALPIGVHLRPLDTSRNPIDLEHGVYDRSAEGGAERVRESRNASFIVPDTVDRRYLSLPRVLQGSRIVNRGGREVMSATFL